MKYGFDVHFHQDNNAVLRLYGDGLQKEYLVEKYGDRLTGFSLVLQNDDCSKIHSVEMKGDKDLLKEIVNHLWCDDLD